MKISLNLALAKTPRERYALAWALPIALLGLGCMVMFSNIAVKEIREYHNVHQELARLRSRYAGLSSKEESLVKVFKHPESMRISREADFVNSLINDKQFSMTDLTRKVTKLLPSDVRLTGMALSQVEGQPTVRLSVAGQGQDAVESFLSNLEGSPDFKNVGLEDQGFKPSAGAGGLITISCTATYVGTGPSGDAGN